jgi:hypothetical protein
VNRAPAIFKSLTDPLESRIPRLFILIEGTYKHIVESEIPLCLLDSRPDKGRWVVFKATIKMAVELLSEVSMRKPYSTPPEPNAATKRSEMQSNPDPISLLSQKTLLKEIERIGSIVDG